MSAIDPNRKIDPERRTAEESDVVIFQTVKQLFGQYVADRDLDTEQLARVSYREFFDWVNAGSRLRDALVSLIDQGVEASTSETLAKIFGCPFEAVKVFDLWWPLLTIARPTPVHVLKELTIGITLLYADGTPANVAARLVGPPEGIIDAVLAGQLAFQVRQLSAQLLKVGVDGVYDLVQQQQPCDVNNDEGGYMPPAAIEGGEARQP